MTFTAGLELQGLTRSCHPTIALLRGRIGIVARHASALRLDRVFVVTILLPAGGRIDVAHDASGLAVGWMRLARVIATIRLLRRRRRPGASARELGVVQNRSEVSDEGIVEGQWRKLLDASESEQCVRVVVGRSGGDRFAFRTAIGQLLIMNVDSLQPCRQVVKRCVRPYVLKVAVDGVIVSETALSLLDAVVAVALERIAPAAVVRRTCVFRVKR
eukprot:4225125-Pleurochrysis_carterae.AAC.1